MTSKKFQTELLNKIDEILNRLPKERFRKIIERRFGLKSGKGETLEAIGKDYNITRERVRQIEADALKILTSAQTIALLKPIFQHLDQVFEQHKHLIGEKQLVDLLFNTSEPNPASSAIIMVLTLGKPYQKFNECHRFCPHWTTQSQAKNQAEKIIDYLVKHFDKHGKPISSSEEVLNFVLDKHQGISERFAKNALDISKEINENIFGEVGLNSWSEITPRGVRDKAYLVLRKEGTPCHFVDITDLINKVNFSSRRAFPQTVHNELIKDKRFVLVGRGLYGLSDWGYKPGVVKDVIVEILSDAGGPLDKEKIISAVLEQRKIKPSTVIVNLQNNGEFEKLEDGRYRLAIS